MITAKIIQMSETNQPTVLSEGQLANTQMVIDTLQDMADSSKSFQVAWLDPTQIAVICHRPLDVPGIASPKANPKKPSHFWYIFTTVEDTRWAYGFAQKNKKLCRPNVLGVLEDDVRPPC